MMLVGAALGVAAVILPPRATGSDAIVLVAIAIAATLGIAMMRSRFALPEGGPDVLHVAPTALALLGVPVQPEMDRAPLPLR